MPELNNSQIHSSPKEPSQQKVSLQVGLDFFAFEVFDVLSDKIQQTKHIQFDKSFTPNSFEHLNAIRSAVAEESILKFDFEQAALSQLNKQVTPVPQKLFVEEKASNYLHYTARVSEKDIVAFDAIDCASLMMVYVPFVNITNYFKGLYSSCKSKHAASWLLESIVKNNQQNSDDELFVYFHSASYEVLAFREGKFLIYNQFDKNSKEDFVYHILFVVKQLNFNPEFFNLMLMGDINLSSDLYKISCQYIRSVSIPDFSIEYL
jgi:hypothetical protein